MTDMRSSNRIRTYLGGRVTISARVAAVGCLVRDISEGGAQLVMTGADDLPSEIELAIPRINLATRARVVWRNGDVCGVQFIGRTDSLPAELASGLRPKGDALSAAGATEPGRL
jgi:hypothetical protein